MTTHPPSDDPGVWRPDRASGPGAAGEREPAASPQPRRLVRKLLLSSMGLVLALAVAEAALHVLGIAARPARLVRDARLGWRNTAGWRGPVFSVNARGFLGAELDVPKPPGTLRIFCLGDSCTAGDLLPDFDQTYPRQLERILRERYPGKPLEVVNAGVGGYSSFQGRLWLEREILGCEPDVVVSYFGWNDHWRARAGGSDKAVSGSWSERARAWLSWSRLVSLSLRAWHRVSRREAVVTDGEATAVVIPSMEGPRRVSLADYEANLRAMAAAMRERSGHTVLVTAPSYLAAAGAARWSDGEAVGRLVAAHADYNEVVRRVARDERAGLVDAAAAFAQAEGPAGLFRAPPGDYIHLSAEGCRRLAEGVADCLAATPRLAGGQGDE